MIELGFYNAAVDLIEGNLPHRAAKVAFSDDRASLTYAELAIAVERAAAALTGLGIEPEQRIVLGLLDTLDFPVAFLGAVRAGIIPIPVNTLFPAPEIAYILADSRAKAAIVSRELLPVYAEAARIAEWTGRLIVSAAAGEAPAEYAAFGPLLGATSPGGAPANTRADDPCFWLYSSGSTGRPKGTIHAQTSLVQTADLFARGVLGMRDGDVVYSAAKLFFAYGLGNALTFPLATGATSILRAARVTPDLVFTTLRDTQVTVFCGVPTLFASLLASPAMLQRDETPLRLCTSAGEALPEELGRVWSARTGVEIIDGIGSTEMLHIFVSNFPGDVRYGTTGRPVPGYDVRLVDETGGMPAPGDIGELEVRGPTAALGYWNNRAKSRHTFAGEWTRTGDKYRVDAAGCYVHCGRADDMLKVGGIWVSPSEVEAALIAHDDVLECAVIGALDDAELVKPKAFVVLRPGVVARDGLVEALQLHVKSRLAPHTYPRWIAFVDELPKTATGKIRRHVLRDRERELAARGA